MSDEAFRAGARCPIDGCPFELAIQCEKEEETIVVGAAATQAHSNYAHGGAPVTLYDVPVLPDSDMDDPEETEERPRLMN